METIIFRWYDRFREGTLQEILVGFRGRILNVYIRNDSLDSL